MNAVDLRVRRGQIHALIGPNGAGKTTFFNLLTKFLIPTAGQILYRGTDITLERPARGRPPRHRALVPDLGGVSAPDGAGERAHRAAARARDHRFTSGSARRRCAVLDARAHGAAGELVDLHGVAATRAAELPYGRKRALELATTLALEPELMLLDEPTQGMGHEDVDRVTELIRQAAAQSHRADGRAQHAGGREHRRHDHRAAAWPGDRQRQLRRGRAQSAGDGGVHGIGGRCAAECARMSPPLLQIAGLHAYYGESHVLHGVECHVDAARW